MILLRNIQLYLFVFLAAAVAGCSETLAKLESKPNALGAMNEIVAVSDDTIWDSFVQDSFLFYFASPYPIMPTPEPLFDVRHFSTEDLMEDRLRKELRTYVILADMRDAESLTTQMARNDLGEETIRRYREDPGFFTTAGLDKWAKGQLVVYILGDGPEQLANNVVRAFPTVARRIATHDAEQLRAATYLEGESTQLSSLVRDKFGFRMNIPGEFQKAIETDNFLWIRKDERELTSNLIFKTFPYTSQDQLDLEGVVTMRDRMGIQIQSSTIGSFMQTNTADLPVYQYENELDGRYSVESRGIWEMTDDYMGGPFLNYSIIDGDRIIVVDGFIFAPGKDKRNYVQQLELIISSIDFEG